MRKVYICLFLTIPFFCCAQSLYYQTAYYDAIQLSEKAPAYLEFIEQIIEEKKALTANAEEANTTFIYKNKQIESSLYTLRQFIQEPNYIGSDPRVQLSDLARWMDQGLSKNDFIEVGPFFDVKNKAILSRTFQEPLYTFDPTTNLFYNLYENQEVLIDYPINSVLTAIYNPLTSTFHQQIGDFFSPVPYAYINSLTNLVQKGTSIFEGSQYPLYEYNDLLEEDLFNHMGTNYIILIYKDTLTEQLSGHYLGRNDPDDISRSGDAQPVLSSGQGIETPYVPFSSPTASFPSKAIDALAQFLVDRTKQELILAFFDRFLEKLEKSSELRTLFPNTYYLLRTQDLFRLPSMGPLWVETFQSDMQNLLPNTEQLIVTDPKYEQLASLPEVKAFRLSHQLLQINELATTPIQTIQQLTDDFGREDDPLSKNILLLNAFAKEVKSIDTLSLELCDQPLTATDLLSLINRRYQALDYFNHFFYFNNQDLLEEIEQHNGINIQETLYRSNTYLVKRLANFSSLLANFEHSCENYRVNKLTLDQQENIPISFSAYGQSVYQLLEFSHQSAYFGYHTNIQKPEKDTYFRTIRNTIQAMEDVHKEERGIFLVHYLQLLEPIINAKFNLANTPEKETATQLIRDVFFYSSFILDVLAAQNSQQIHGILQQYALPVGSYKLKRRSAFSLDVNAYPGLYLGLEQGLGNALESGNIFGVTAPIGLAMNWGETEHKNGHAFGLFVPIIDIGAAFSYRWKNTAEGFPEQLNWRQVMSLGLHGVWGIKKVPISLMAGAQFTPRLRTIEQGAAINEQSVWRIGASVVVDIPIFNLHLKE